MIILNSTMDLIDDIANAGFTPRAYSGRYMYGKYCVGCVVEYRSQYDDLFDLIPGAMLDNFGLDFIVYWPTAEWTPGVQEYVDTIYDPSGENT
jgi:hypothetical protein